MMLRSSLIGILMLTQTAVLAAAADNYPVSGRWTYEDAAAKGPAKSCGKRNMEFRGAQRLDSGSGASQYRNVSVSRNSASSFDVIDEFFTVQIRGRVAYVLNIRDDDHIQLAMARKTILLRRCE